jgi:hypothetical protein
MDIENNFDTFELDLDSNLTSEDFEGFEADEVAESTEEVIEQTNEEGNDEENNEESTEGTFTLKEEDEHNGVSDDITDVDLVKNIATAFKKDGILDVDDADLEGVKDLEGFAALVKKTIQKSEFADLNDEAKAALEAIRKGVPIEAIKATYNAELTINSIKEDDFIESDTDTDEEAEDKKSLRANLIMRDFLNKGFSREKAEKLLKRSVESGDDIDDAKEAHANLQSSIKERKAADLKVAEENKIKFEKSQKELVESVEKTKEIFPGLPVSEEVKKFIIKGLTTPTGKKENGQLRTVVSDKREEDQRTFDTRLLYLIKIGLFEKEADLSTLKNSKVVSAVKELEKNLNQGGNYKGGRGLSLGNSGKSSLDYDALDSLNL